MKMTVKITISMTLLATGQWPHSPQPIYWGSVSTVFTLAIVIETLVPLLLQVAIMISPKSSIASSRFFGFEKSLASLKPQKMTKLYSPVYLWRVKLHLKQILYCCIINHVLHIQAYPQWLTLTVHTINMAKTNLFFLLHVSGLGLSARRLYNCRDDY